MSSTSPEQDSVWKEVLDYYFKEFLDKELEKIVRDSALGRRLADKLVRVHLLDGSETWLLIHIEVQGYFDLKFEERMYVYNYRIFDRYHREVISLALLTDSDERYRPSRYHVSRWGFEHSFRFPVIKLLDYRDKWEQLEQDLNPFAVVVMAQLTVQQVRTVHERLAWKLKLVRLLYERGYARQDVLELFRFIDWLLALPEELERSFWREISKHEEEIKMPYITSVERMGIQQGMREGLLEAIELGLSLRFGVSGLALLPEIRKITDNDRLRAIKEALLQVQSVEELRPLLP